MRSLAGLVAVLAVAVAVSAPHWRGAIEWSPDGLFYEAQVREVRGESAEAARRAVFTGPVSAERRAQERGLAAAERRVTSPEWVEYSAEFYRRRWLVPVLAAAVEPAFGDRSLVAVAIAGYVVAAALLYLLLRRRFGPAAAAIGALVAVLAPQFRENSLLPLTDSWGLALETGALLAAVLALERPTVARVAGWTALVAALAWTRDTAVVIVAACLLVALVRRARPPLVLAATGLLALLPPLLAFDADARKLLAFTLNDFRIPPETSWGFVWDRYWPALGDMIGSWVEPQGSSLPPATGIVAAVGLLALALVRVERSALVDLLRALAVAGLLYLCTLPQNGFRIAIALAPAVGGGYALLAARALARSLTGAARRATR